MIKGKLRSVDDFQSIFSGKHRWANPDWFHLRSIILHQLVSHAPPAGGRKWSPGQSYLDTEVSSVHVVSEEQIAGVAGWAAHLKKLHQVKELAVDVPTHWRHTHTHTAGFSFSKHLENSASGLNWKPVESRMTISMLWYFAVKWITGDKAFIWNISYFCLSQN